MRFFSLIFFALLALIFASCEKQENHFENQISFTDDIGRKVRLSRAEKIASLQGSLSRAWISAGGKIGGFTEDFLTEIKEGAASEDCVKGAQNLGAMMSPNIELIMEGDYDFVLLSAAVPQHKKMLDTLENARLPCAYFKLESFEDYCRIMEIFCKIAGGENDFKKNTAFEKNVIEQKEKIEKIKSEAAEKITEKPRILLLRSSSGKISARSSSSNATGAMLADLHCINIADEIPAMLEDLSMEKIILSDPDFIFVTAMGASSKKAEEYFFTVFGENPAWQTLSAVKENRVIFLPRRLFHYKPCENWSEAYLYLFNIFYKEIDK